MTGPETSLSIVRDLAREAGRRVMELLRSPLVTSRKADHSLVTNADHAANELLCAGLRRRFPDHGILSEETGLEGPPGAEFLWVIDPLDGTRAYAKGLPGFSVMVGLLRNGQPQAGVVYDPITETPKPQNPKTPKPLFN
jgi:fructose-1,6-bisphosphatase/inositol monophosphatase family enzyme